MSKIELNDKKNVGDLFNGKLLNINRAIVKSSSQTVLALQTRSLDCKIL
jgi:hypothetical protein